MIAFEGTENRGSVPSFTAVTGLPGDFHWMARASIGTHPDWLDFFGPRLSNLLTAEEIQFTGEVEELLCDCYTTLTEAPIGRTLLTIVHMFHNQQP